MKKKILLLILSFSIIGSTFIACGNSNSNTPNETSQEEIKDINPEEITNKIMNTINLRALGAINEEEAKEIFKLNLDQIEKFSIQKGQMNTGLETIAIIKTKSGQANNIKKSLEEYKNSINPLYPGEQEAIDNSKLIEKGDYLGFFIIPDYEEGQDNLSKVVEIFNNEFK